MTERRRYLTTEELRALPDYTEVWILWSGGNGPFKYRIKHNLGLTYCVLNRADGQEYFMKDAIKFVGDQKPFTMVWLP